MSHLPIQTEKKLGFTEIREWLHDRTATDFGKQKILEMTFISDSSKLLSELQRVSEVRDILNFDERFRISSGEGIAEMISKSEPENNWLDAQDFFQLKEWLQTAIDIPGYFKSRKEKYPGLFSLTANCQVSRELLREIEKTIDERGDIRPNASPELAGQN